MRDIDQDLEDGRDLDDEMTKDDDNVLLAMADALRDILRDESA